MTKEQKAINFLAKKFAIISTRIRFEPFYEFSKKLVPSIIKNNMEQAIHLIYKDGGVQLDVCSPSICKMEGTECIELKSGQCVGAILALKTDVDKVVVLIRDHIRKHREMIVYQL